MSIELVSFANLKSFMNLADAAITDYPALGVIRDSVTAAFENHTSRLFEEIERTQTIFIGRCVTSMISLSGVPVASVSTVTVTIGGDDESYTEDDDYEITSYGIRLFSELKNSKIVVVYTGGLSAVPMDIARAALLQTVHEFQSKDQIGAESVSTDGGTISHPPLGLLKEVRRILRQYIHPLGW